jgi:hypothetical protein
MVFSKRKTVTKSALGGIIVKPLVLARKWGINETALLGLQPPRRLKTSMIGDRNATLEWLG